MLDDEAGKSSLELHADSDQTSLGLLSGHTDSRNQDTSS